MGKQVPAARLGLLLLHQLQLTQAEPREVSDQPGLQPELVAARLA